MSRKQGKKRRRSIVVGILVKLYPYAFTDVFINERKYVIEKIAVLLSDYLQMAYLKAHTRFKGKLQHLPDRTYDAGTFYSVVDTE